MQYEIFLYGCEFYAVTPQMKRLVAPALRKDAKKTKH